MKKKFHEHNQASIKAGNEKEREKHELASAYHAKQTRLHMVAGHGSKK